MQAPEVAPGTELGGRFVVEAAVREDGFGSILRAKDKKTSRPVALRVFAPGLLTPDELRVLRDVCRQVSKVRHENLAALFGMGASQTPFVATEWVGGESLDEFVTARAGGQPLDLEAAFRIVSQLCHALTALHAHRPHGAIRPGAVRLHEGELKLVDAGVGAILLASKGPGALPPKEQAALAPEVKVGNVATAQSDIFGVGAILYQLLTGRSPADGFVPPSQVHPEADARCDELLLKCLAADPNARFSSPDEVRVEFGAIVGADEGIEIDISLSSLPPSSGAAPVTVPKAPLPPRAMAAPAAVVAAPAAAQQVDLGGLLAKITENDAPRWMAQRNGLDHGPFSGRELVEMIAKGEVVEDHTISNMDTGERKSATEWAEFREFLEQYKLKRAAQDKAAALETAVKSEKRSGVAKLAIGGALLVLLVGGIVGFIMTRDAASEEEVAQAELDDLFARGEIERSGSAGILPDPPARRGGRRGMGGGGGGGGGGMAGFAGSYEQAMNIAVDIGDATMGGGQGRLNGGQVAGVMNRHLNRIFNACVVPESRAGRGLGNVDIDIAIAGSGQVMGVSARQGSGSFKSCVRRVVRGIRFPSFAAPRMGTRYSFSGQ